MDRDKTVMNNNPDMERNVVLKDGGAVCGI
jgi:hypothetical protein